MAQSKKEAKHVLFEVPRSDNSYIGVAEANEWEASHKPVAEEQLKLAFSQLVVIEALLVEAWRADEERDRDLCPFSNTRVAEAAYHLMVDSLKTLRRLDLRPATEQEGRADDGKHL